MREDSHYIRNLTRPMTVLVSTPMCINLSANGQLSEEKNIYSLFASLKKRDQLTTAVKLSLISLPSTILYQTSVTENAKVLWQSIHYQSTTTEQDSIKHLPWKMPMSYNGQYSTIPHPLNKTVSSICHGKCQCHMTVNTVPNHNHWTKLYSASVKENAKSL